MEITRLQQRLGYQFKTVDLLTQALTHRSVNQRSNYERLEFMGDALLGTIIAQYLYQDYPKDDEGRLTRMRATLVRQETLATIAVSLELGPRLILSVGEKKSGGHQRASILADVVEAIIGAIWLDCQDLERLRQVVMMWFAPYLSDIEPGKVLKDPKTLLQEWLQAKRLPLPRYTMVSVEGDAPNQFFTIHCTVSGVEQPAVGTGTSRRNAEQEAATLIIAKLES